MRSGREQEEEERRGGEERRRGEETRRGDEERRRGEERRGEEEQATDIKSNNPHLAGGEKYVIFFYAWRQTLHDHQKTQRCFILAQIFSCWRDGRAEALAEFDKLHTMQDHLIPGALWHFRRLGRLVSAALRHDDCKFFEALLAEGAEFLNPAEVKNLWRVVRRTLPKFQQRKVGYNPHNLVSLEGKWAPHFEELECGIPSDGPGLIGHCIQVNQLSQDGRPRQVYLQQLPSLCELEDALRQTQADRSTGFDPVPSAVYHHHAPFLAKYFYQVLLKAFMWGCEPVQSKGGELKMIPKKQGAIEVHHFRGILLLHTFAKRLHAILRARLMQQTALRRDPQDKWEASRASSKGMEFCGFIR